MEIIVKGASGVGKTIVAEAIASRLGMEVLDEWNGRSALPSSVVAVTNVDRLPVVYHERVVIEVTSTGGAVLAPFMLCEAEQGVGCSGGHQ